MSARGYLFDNDVIIKLSQYGLLYELAEIFGNDFNNFYVLPTFEYVASFNKPEPHSRYFNTPESWVLAKNFFYQCSPAEIVDITFNFDRTHKAR